MPTKTETRRVIVEPDLRGFTVAVFRDVQFRFGRLAVFSMQEEHQVGILFDTTAIAKMAQLWSLALAFAVQLAQSEDWYAFRQSQRLQGGGCFANLFPSLLAAVGRLDQAKVVNDD